ncbi:hypothetical protein C7475_102310 [Chitinophaga sp. S165]|nr:hypothetical protein C7475_102310 [Chitinophaga sp. S165]
MPANSLSYNAKLRITGFINALCYDKKLQYVCLSAVNMPPAS